MLSFTPSMGKGSQTNVIVKAAVCSEYCVQAYGEKIEWEEGNSDRKGW